MNQTNQISNSNSNSNSSLVDFSDERFVKDVQTSLNNLQTNEFIPDANLTNALANKSQPSYNNSKRRSNCVSNNQIQNSNISNRTFDTLASTIASVASGESGSFEQGAHTEHIMIDNEALSMDLIGILFLSS